MSVLKTRCSNNAYVHRGRHKKDIDNKINGEVRCTHISRSTWFDASFLRIGYTDASPWPWLPAVLKCFVGSLVSLDRLWATGSGEVDGDFNAKGKRPHWPSNGGLANAGKREGEERIGLVPGSDSGSGLGSGSGSGSGSIFGVIICP
ncbi:hypothetical protein FISHEDRAFT_55022 [Fistulina hepatica ATCC 64428]|uniref:Uncharacterized protein n=1 Tax=Fistulina hepatica ATCC 64428 TaxID=1128425 RepID=A0A0D7AQ24_9AGAR|nr:hypothetical protein FISHEDRAFT_55022 [Fistulina hepatica ATCC 64428]